MTAAEEMGADSIAHKFVVGTDESSNTECFPKIDYSDLTVYFFSTF
jgi:hypothetical protein